MKVLVISDSHLRLEKIVAMFEIENPDAVVCAGDHSRDAQELSFIKDSVPYYIVRGNCDFFDYDFKDIEEFELNNHKFYLTHGHLQGVKGSYSKLKSEAERNGADIVVFGHTHIAHYEEEKGIHYFNPGAAIDGRYGILEFEGERIKFEHKRLG